MQVAQLTRSKAFSFSFTSQNSAWLKGCRGHFCVSRHYRGRKIDLTFCHVKSSCEHLRAACKTLKALGYTGLYQQKPLCAQILLQGGPGRAPGRSSACSTSSFSCHRLFTVSSLSYICPYTTYLPAEGRSSWPGISTATQATSVA